mmetsp:Transcript_104987/g.318552  ORF Transcript_104987/g.318552 Transcript_104987/m.318552 type:complete len:502 (-) Transcript_104987:201-1706(-)
MSAGSRVLLRLCLCSALAGAERLVGVNLEQQPAFNEATHAIKLLRRAGVLGLNREDVEAHLAKHADLRRAVSGHLAAETAGKASDAARFAAALLQRARPALAGRASSATLDAAVAGKEDDDDADETGCTCFLEEIETETWYGDEHEIKFADLDGAGEFEDLEECARKCPKACHAALKFKFDPSEAKVMGAPGAHVPMTASKCSDDGECKCLDATETTRKVKEYRERESKTIDIADLKQTYGSSEECLKECECKDRKTRSLWSEKDLDYEGLCVDEWRWRWFLNYDVKQCDGEPDWDPVGLVDCKRTQQFELKQDVEGGKLEYKARLYELSYEEARSDVELRHHVPVADIDFKVMELGEGEGNYKTATVKVGPENAAREFQVYKSQLVGLRWSWRVADTDGNVLFTINEQKEEDYQTWKIYQGKKHDDRPLYWVQGWVGVHFKFYRSKDNQLVAVEEVEEGKHDKCLVRVVPGVDAGLVLVARALIGRSYALEKGGGAAGSA